MILASFALRHALVLGALAATAWAAGRIGLRALGLGRGVVPHSFAVAVGLALLAQGSLLLGLFGSLRIPILVSSVVVVHVAAIGDWRQVAAAATRLSSRRWLRLTALGIVIAALAIPLFLPALYPPLGFGQTTYHLPYARAFAGSGALPFLPDLRYPVFPQLAEILAADVLLFAGVVATQLVGWLALVTCIGLVFVMTRELTSPLGGWIAAAVLAGSPIAFYLASTGYVEPVLALFGLAALYAAGRGRQESRLAWVVLSGGLAGTAAGTKYLGLFFVPVAAFFLLKRGSRRVTARQLGYYMSAVAIALCPSYGRLLVYTGNPLFPFYPEIFGTSPWAPPDSPGQPGIAQIPAALTFLWDITFRPHATGALPPFSPAFSIGLPLAIAGAWHRPALRRPLLVVAAYVLLAPLRAHYFLGIAPLWSIVIGASAVTLGEGKKWGRWALPALAIALAIGGEAYAVVRLQRLGLPPATVRDRERLLAAQQPLYPAIAFINGVSGGATVYGIGAENMMAYASGPLRGDFNGPASYARVEALVLARGSLSAALDEVGAEYFLVPNRPSRWIEWAVSDPRLQRIHRDSRATVYRVLPP